MAKKATTSAGILLYRVGDGGVLEVLVAHMGGPFWAKKDAGAWSIIKGEVGTSVKLTYVRKGKSHTITATRASRIAFFSTAESRASLANLPCSGEACQGGIRPSSTTSAIMLAQPAAWR